MKKTILIIGLMLGCFMSQAQNVSGSWNGILNLQGNEIKIVFNLTKTGENYVTMMYSPSEKENGFSTTSTEFKDSILTIKMDKSNLQFQGRLLKSNIIKGVFTQMNKQYALELTNPKLTVSKPDVKTARKYHAYSYYIEDVVLDNNEMANLNLPIKKGKAKAVVIECDYKKMDANEKVGNKNSINELSDHLSSNGFAVLYSTTCISTESAIAHLKTLPEVNNMKISVIKISERGITAMHLNEGNKMSPIKEIKNDVDKNYIFNQLTNWLLLTV